MPSSPVELLRSLAPGTRVVVRRRIEGGFADTLGDLVAHDGATVTIRTRRGNAVVLLEDVVAAKPVPPPPPRRAARRPEG
ncbi:hypothetical protein RBS60_12920 [Sinomonas sp. ASV486]|uniref:Ferrous iron transport protein A n=1 Tax=Sinomonas puerhi TaxID=3238584 RepID=A0AB39L1D1_9MICC|nr:hypothetical protein [Sinomonas sp. ASV486]MDQ4491098.1 hypothetical protein [Sinomonas sp. ASV486]